MSLFLVKLSDVSSPCVGKVLGSYRECNGQGTHFGLGVTEQILPLTAEHKSIWPVPFLFTRVQLKNESTANMETGSGLPSVTRPPAAIFPDSTNKTATTHAHYSRRFIKIIYIPEAPILDMR
jgi:hypothetical protein